MKKITRYLFIPAFVFVLSASQVDSQQPETGYFQLANFVKSESIEIKINGEVLFERFPFANATGGQGLKPEKYTIEVYADNHEPLELEVTIKPATTANYLIYSKRKPEPKPGEPVEPAFEILSVDLEHRPQDSGYTVTAYSAEARTPVVVEVGGTTHQLVLGRGQKFQGISSSFRSIVNGKYVKQASLEDPGHYFLIVGKPSVDRDFAQLLFYNAEYKPPKFD